LIDRALFVFEKLFKGEEGLLNITEQRLFLEGEVLKCVDLLSLDKRASEKVALLKALSECQESHSEWPWRYQRRVLFELGQTYELIGKQQQAMEVYDRLIEASAHVTSYTGSAALLHRCRLEFDRLTPEQREQTDPHLVQLLNRLKELQVKKNIQSEPLHLEAALDYAEIRTSLEKGEERDQKYLFFLSRLKEDFQSQEEPLSQHYHLVRKELDERDELFQSYMEYVDAESMRVHALIHRGEGKEKEAQILEERAEEHLQALLSKSTNHYFAKRVQKSLERIGHIQEKSS
jgi:hypothetical protein